MSGKVDKKGSKQPGDPMTTALTKSMKAMGVKEMSDGVSELDDGVFFVNEAVESGFDKDARARKLSYPNQDKKARGSLFLDNEMFSEWKADLDSIYNRMRYEGFRASIDRLDEKEIFLSEAEARSMSRFSCEDRDMVLRQRLWSDYSKWRQQGCKAKDKLLTGFGNNLFSRSSITDRLRCKYYCLFLSFPPRDYSDFIDYIEERYLTIAQQMMSQEFLIKTENGTDNYRIDYKILKTQMELGKEFGLRKRGAPKMTMSHELTSKGASQAEKLQKSLAAIATDMKTLSAKDVTEYIEEMDEAVFSEIIDVKALPVGKKGK